MQSCSVEGFIDPIDFDLVVVKQFFGEFDCAGEVDAARSAEGQKLSEDVIVDDPLLCVDEELDGFGMPLLVQMVVAKQSRCVDPHDKSAIATSLVFPQKILVDSRVVRTSRSPETGGTGVGSQTIQVLLSFLGRAHLGGPWTVFDQPLQREVFEGRARFCGHVAKRRCDFVVELECQGFGHSYDDPPPKREDLPSL
jgi:hypothetical protein